MTFSALHISDIHYDDESTSREEFRRELAKKISKDQLQANCIIISGDLFNRGALEKSKLESYRTFFNQLPGHEFMLAVPGNHDLDRSVQKSKMESLNVYTTRRDIVLTKGNLVIGTGDEFELTDGEKGILYKMAFQAFRTFARQMGFRSYYQDDSTLTAENYEVQVVDYPLNVDLGHKVRFVLLNTALIAGQSVRGDLYRERQSILKKAAQQALASGDLVDAAEIKVKIARQQKHFEDDGELIIDEERKGMSGRLSLSMVGNQRLSEMEPDGAILTVFVGHHGFQYFSKETQEALKQAMKTCNSGIYLCGHTHQVRFQRFSIQQRSYPKDVEQIQAGVMFKDETGISQYGFNYLSLSVEKDKLDLKVMAYYLVKDASEEQRWLRETIIDYHDILPDNKPQEITPENTNDKACIIENTLPIDSTSGRPAATHDFRFADLLSSRDDAKIRKELQ